MIDRRSSPWILGLAALVLLVTATAIILLWTSSEMSVRANEFYTSQTGTEPLPDRTYEYWNTVSSNAYVLYTVAAPLFVGALTAAFALLAVLAFRWERRGRVADV